MNISEFRIASMDVGEDCTRWLYDDAGNQFVDGSSMWDYSVGDRVRVGWSYFGGETREVLWAERIG